MPTLWRSQLTLRDRGYALKRAAVGFWLDSGLDSGAKQTFFTLLAFAPTLLAVYSVATLVLANNAGLVRSVTDDFINSYVLGEYEDLVRDVVAMVTGSTAGGVLGLVVSVLISLFSASGYVRAFSRTANSVWGVREGRTLITLWGSMWLVTVVLVIGMVVVLAALTVNDTMVNTVLAPFAEPLGLEGFLAGLTQSFLPVWRWVKWPVIVAVCLLMLAVLYHYTPNVKLPKFRWLTSGAVVGFIGVAIVGTLFAGYITFFGGLSSYGALGTVLAVIFAMWGMNTAVVFGLMVDAESEKMHQRKKGVWISDEVHDTPADASVGAVAAAGKEGFDESAFADTTADGDVEDRGGEGEQAGAPEGAGASGDAGVSGAEASEVEASVDEERAEEDVERADGDDSAQLTGLDRFGVPVRADDAILFQDRVRGRLSAEGQRRLEEE